MNGTILQTQRWWFSVSADEMFLKKSHILIPAETVFMQRNRSSSKLYLRSYTDGPIFVNLQCRDCFCLVYQGGKEYA